MGAPSDDDHRTLVESVRSEALMERRRRNLVVGRESSFLISFSGERLEVLAYGLLSRAMGGGSQSRTAFPPATVSLGLEAAMPVSSESAPWFFVGHSCFSWAIDQPLVMCSGKQVLSLRMMSSWVTCLCAL